ncbi:hypothetical protein AGMMS49579_01470 [Spirochaetia bacterium]|nr:hypothetical protein AGMMS49579_01470 [Spirochaetia bacterium]
MSNIYNLICSKYVLNTHTFKGPKCFISFGTYEKFYPPCPTRYFINVEIKYYNPIKKHFRKIDLTCFDDIKKIEYNIRNDTYYLIVWNINRPNNILKQKDEKVPKNQIGTAVCKVYLNNKVNTLFLSCNHAICRTYCSDQLKKCPICKSLITSKIKINIV